MNVTHALNKHAEAARLLLQDLGLINDPDKPADNAALELAHDTVEGETMFFEAIDAVDISIIEDEAQVEALTQIINTMEGRKKAAKARVASKKTMLLRALEMVGIQNVKRPTGTIFLMTKGPKLVVTDESLIPSHFFTQPPAPPAPPPVLDEDAIEALLLSHREKLEQARAIEDEAQREAAIKIVEDTFKPIPGATLDNGSVSLSIRRK